MAIDKILSEGKTPIKVLQIDTVPHTTATFDVVIERTG
jgi:hypothetical protein